MAPSLRGADAQAATPRDSIRSGRHLIAFVFVSSHCGACRFPPTEKAIQQIRTSLRAAHARAFANVSVIVVAIDDLSDGTGYVQALNRTGRVFDQYSIGGTWMNQLVSQEVWRDGVALPATPQVLLVQRNVDATQWPQSVTLQPDSVLLRLVGRNEVIDWVERGTPLLEE